MSCLIEDSSYFTPNFSTNQNFVSKCIIEIIPNVRLQQEKVGTLVQSKSKDNINLSGIMCNSLFGQWIIEPFPLKKSPKSSWQELKEMLQWVPQKWNILKEVANGTLKSVYTASKSMLSRRNQKWAENKKGARQKLFVPKIGRIIKNSKTIGSPLSHPIGWICSPHWG